ncbi:unnamed protein product [Lampetra planeri]
MTSPHRAMADEEDDFMGEEEGEEGAVATATASSSGQRGRHRLFSKERERGRLVKSEDEEVGAKAHVAGPR